MLSVARTAFRSFAFRNAPLGSVIHSFHVLSTDT